MGRIFQNGDPGHSKNSCPLSATVYIQSHSNGNFFAHKNGIFNSVLRILATGCTTRFLLPPTPQ
jgi:hypothetical protein